VVLFARLELERHQVVFRESAQAKPMITGSLGAQRIALAVRRIASFPTTIDKVRI
jgi:hypothetical protein